MPEAKKNISADAKRSILQHLMFGMLGLLILMNWSVYRPLDYDPFNETFIINSSESIEYKNYQTKRLLNYFSEEDPNIASHYLNVQNVIVNFAQKEIQRIELTKIAFKDSAFSLSKQKIIIDSTLSSLDKLRDTLVNLIDPNNIRKLPQYLPIKEEEIQFCRDIIHCTFLPFDYFTNSTYTALLYGLQNKVENSRRMCLEILYDMVHVPLCFFSSGRAACVVQNQLFFNGDNVITHISNVDFFVFSRKYSFALAEKGLLDLSELNSNGIVYWKDIAKDLGKNTVSGTITRLYQKDTITRPFSFSYFVSAPGIAFHLDKANLCYVGVPNPISISVPGYPADKIKLRVADAKVSKTGDGRFEIFFSKIPSNKVYAYVEATNEQGRTSTVHSMELKVKELPSPTTNLSSFKESGIRLEELKNLKSIKVQPVDSAFGMEYEVISFQVEGITQDGKYIEPITVYGAEFSNKQELMSVFNVASVGDRFIFSNIRAKATNGREYEALPVSLLLK